MLETLKNRKLFIPELDYGGARILAASFRSLGIDSEVVPESTRESLKKGFAETSGEECYPQQITLGDFLGILDSGMVTAEKAAFFMPTATGPCRFGQYATLIRTALKERGYGDAVVYSLTSEDGYTSVGGISFVRRIWWGIVATDQLRRCLLKIRPYEKREGVTDEVYEDGLKKIVSLIESETPTDKNLFKKIEESLTISHDQFSEIEKYDIELPLIGVVGEIFCRLNTFSNNNLIRRMERMGAEAWLAGVSEWILYTGVGERLRLAEEGQRFSKKMLKAAIKDRVIKKDEHKLAHIFKDLLRGREEESNIEKLLKQSEPYLPSGGSLGEMTLNVANAVHMYKHGADGIVDISPFTCMNGIASEAVYPRVSRDHGGIPIRIFYFDGTESDLERDLGIFLELARNYSQKKTIRI